MKTARAETRASALEEQIRELASKYSQEISSLRQQLIEKEAEATAARIDMGMPQVISSGRWLREESLLEVSNAICPRHIAWLFPWVLSHVLLDARTGRPARVILSQATCKTLGRLVYVAPTGLCAVLPM